MRSEVGRRNQFYTRLCDTSIVPQTQKTSDLDLSVISHLKQFMPPSNAIGFAPQPHLELLCPSNPRHPGHRNMSRKMPNRTALGLAGRIFPC